MNSAPLNTHFRHIFDALAVALETMLKSVSADGPAITTVESDALDDEERWRRSVHFLATKTSPEGLVHFEEIHTVVLPEEAPPAEYLNIAARALQTAMQTLAKNNS